MASTSAANSDWSIVGKTVVITGANSGIGKATAEALAKAGAGRVILACRNVTAGDAAAKEIREKAGNLSEDRVVCRQLDLSSLASVRQFAANLQQSETALHVLICNAGVWPGNQRQVTPDGNELTFATNHLGHFLLARLLIDFMKKSAPSRIVVVASKGYCFCWPSGYNIDDPNAEKPGAYSGTNAYCQSKLANMLFARSLNKFLNGSGQHSGISVFVLYPGAIQTQLIRSLSSGVQRFSRPFLNPIEVGIKTPVYCATQPGIEHLTGSYFVNCKLSRAWAIATDDIKSDRLWLLSEKLCGLGQ